MWAILLTAAIAAFVGGYYLHSGFGLGIDLAFAFVVAALGIPIVALLVALLLTIFRRLPRLVSGFIFGSCLFISLLWPQQLGIMIGIVYGIVEGVLGATIATLLFGHFRRISLARKIVTTARRAAKRAAPGRAAQAPPQADVRNGKKFRTPRYWPPY